VVVDKAFSMPNSTSFAKALIVNKTSLYHHLFNENGEGLIELLKGENFNQTMSKFAPLCSFNIHNLIASFKHHLENMSFIDCIIMLKAFSPSNCIQNNYFPGQEFAQKVYLFKI
jgi:hypothetical protein